MNKERIVPMNIAMGSDHGGYELKEALRRRLEEQGHQIEDAGCFGEAVDYPEIAVKVAGIVVSGGADFGILCCGTGIGISIAANKIQGIRAALCTDCYSARMAKEHNDANIIAFGGRTVGVEHAWEMVGAYLGARHLGGVHARRVAQIDAL